MINNHYSSENYKKHTSKNPFVRFVNSGFQKSVKNNIMICGEKNVLEIGCGEGFIINYLKMDNIIGVDFSKEAIKYAKSANPDNNFLTGNIYDIPFSDESFDIVMALEILEHLNELEKAIQEIYRVSNNYCLFSVPNEPYFRLMNILRLKNITRLGNNIEHVQNWSSRGFEKLIGKYFKIINISKPYPTIILCKK